jgi:hypothetical protein
MGINNDEPEKKRTGGREGKEISKVGQGKAAGDRGRWIGMGGEGTYNGIRDAFVARVE